MNVMLRNSWTTVFGVLAGILNYLGNQGASLPTTRQGWITLLISATLAGLGLVAKDATTGSKPPGA